MTPFLENMMSFKPTSGSKEQQQQDHQKPGSEVHAQFTLDKHIQCQKLMQAHLPSAAANSAQATPSDLSNPKHKMPDFPPQEQILKLKLPPAEIMPVAAFAAVK